MSHESEFKKNPTEFLKAFVIVIPEDKNMDATRDREPHDFQFVEVGSKNVLELKFHNAGGGESISAYWLPWLTQKAPSLKLGKKASFFFTSEMTGCRFSVFDQDKKEPTVAHVAGDITTSIQRDKAESDEPKLPPDLTRRLSRSGGVDSKLGSVFSAGKMIPGKLVPKKHEYRGLYAPDEDDQSSAFVFGQSKNEEWEFFAQIVKGNMAKGFYKNMTTDNLQILQYVKI